MVKNKGEVRNVGVEDPKSAIWRLGPMMCVHEKKIGLTLRTMFWVIYTTKHGILYIIFWYL